MKQYCIIPYKQHLRKSLTMTSCEGFSDFHIKPQRRQWSQTITPISNTTF